MTKQFEILIDGETFEAPENKMSANDILVLGGLSAAEYYLVELKGKKQDSFQDKGDTIINLHQGSEFVSVFIGATPVALNQLTGAALFAEQLKNCGYNTEELGDDHVKFPYTVEVGKCAGMEMEMGFVVPEDFPLTPPHGPHLSIKIHPEGGGGREHPTGGIHSSSGRHKHFGDDWQHWSRPHPNWTDGNRDAARYMAFIRSLWDTQ